MVAVIRATVPRLNLDAAFEQKNEIAKAVEDELEKVMILTTKSPYVYWCSYLTSLDWEVLFLFTLQAMSAYGFEIVQTLIVDIEPDIHVKRAMNEINAGKVYI